MDHADRPAAPSPLDAPNRATSTAPKNASPAPAADIPPSPGRGGPDLRRYLHGHDDAVLRSHRHRTAANSCGYLLPHLWPNARILDVGCGPGTITCDLALAVPDGAVVGLDAAADVLDEAWATATAAGVSNVSFVVGDVTHLEFPDGTFDVVHAHQLLQHLPDPVAALAEMRRVCRPGGLVAARDADYGAMCWHPASPGLDRWQALYRAVARTAGGEPDAGRHLRAWALDAGCTSVTATASAWCYASDEERAWWGGLWADRVTGTRFAEQAVAAALATPAELDELAAAWRAWAAEPTACFLIPHGEVLCTR
jgi:SAM-dependent methyltransferase